MPWTNSDNGDPTWIDNGRTKPDGSSKDDYAKWGLTQTNNMIGSEEGQMRDESDFWPGVEGVLKARGIDPTTAFGNYFGPNDVTPGWQVEGGDPKTMYYNAGNIDEAYTWLTQAQRDQIKAQSVNGLIPVGIASQLAQSSPYRNGNQSGDGFGGLTDALSGFMDNGGGVLGAMGGVLGAVGAAGGFSGLFGGAAETAMGAAGAGESIMAGGYGSNLAASGFGAGSTVTGLSLEGIGAGALTPSATGLVSAVTPTALGGTMGSLQQWAQSLGALGPDGTINWNAIDSSSVTNSMEQLGEMVRPDASYNPDASTLNPSSTTTPGAPGIPTPPPGASTIAQLLKKAQEGDTDAILKLLQAGGSVGSGIYGLVRANQMSNLGNNAATAADPWGQSGGRAAADTQLQALLRDPAQVSANDPAFKLRMQAAQRATASQGQRSGAMAVSAANASTDWYNQRLQQLGGLAGAPGNPAVAGELRLKGSQAGNDLISQALGSIGYGIGSLNGANSQIPPALLQRLLLQMSARP